jgi:hypothetical protein
MGCDLVLEHGLCCQNGIQPKGAVVEGNSCVFHVENKPNSDRPPSTISFSFKSKGSGGGSGGSSFLTDQALQASTSKNTGGWTYCLDVPNGKTTAYSPLNVFGCNAQDNQIWTYDPSTQSITNKNSGLCLSISGAATDANPGVGQDTCSGSENQKWAYDAATTTITSPYMPGACLDVSGGKINNRTRIGMYKCSGAGNQTWTPTDPTTAKGVNDTKTAQMKQSGQGGGSPY